MAWISDEVIQAGTFLIAALALARPELTRLYKKLFKPPLLDIHEAGYLEVGFSAFGNTICTRGTLRPVNLSQFITSINLEIIRMKDNVQHDFNWCLFREDSIIKNQSQTSDQSTASLAHSFNVFSDQSHFYSILFMDALIRDDLLRLLAETKKRWDDCLQQVMSRSTNIGYPDLRKEAYLAFMTSSSREAFESRLKILFFWEVSKYSVKMKVNCSRPNKVFIKNWEFTITEEESETLKRNAFTTISAVPEVIPISFNFVYPKYE